MIVFIALQTFLHIYRVEFVLLEREQNLSIYWDWILAYHNPLKTDCFGYLSPLMIPDILN